MFLRAGLNYVNNLCLIRTILKIVIYCIVTIICAMDFGSGVSDKKLVEKFYGRQVRAGST